jgi:hypothetical protein
MESEVDDSGVQVEGREQAGRELDGSLEPGVELGVRSGWTEKRDEKRHEDGRSRHEGGTHAELSGGGGGGCDDSTYTLGGVERTLA